MKKSTLFLIILVAIFFTSTLVLIYLNYLKPQSIPTPTIATFPTKIPTPDPTTNWKTYENKKYGFSFKYPDYLHQIKSTVSSNSLPSEKFQSDDFQTEDGIENTIVSKGLNLAYTYNDSMGCDTSEDITKNELKIITIDNHETRRYFVSWEGMIFYAADVFLPKSCLNISLNYGNNYNKDQVLDIFSQILSTFKFTDQAISSALEVAKKYLDASVKGDLETAKIYCPSMERTALDGYSFVKYEITDSKPDVNPNYYHVYIKFTDKDGLIWDKAPHSNNPLELFMSKDKDGNWKSSTWYFYQ